MTIDDIIRNAKDSRYTGMKYDARIRLYESYKHDIANLELTATQYTRAISQLADALGV